MAVEAVEKEDPLFLVSGSISLTAGQYHGCFAGKHKVRDCYDVGMQFRFRSAID